MIMIYYPKAVDYFRLGVCITTRQKEKYELYRLKDRNIRKGG